MRRRAFKTRKARKSPFWPCWESLGRSSTSSSSSLSTSTPLCKIHWTSLELWLAVRFWHRNQAVPAEDHGNTDTAATESHVRRENTENRFPSNTDDTRKHMSCKYARYFHIRPGSSETGAFLCMAQSTGRSHSDPTVIFNSKHTMMFLTNFCRWHFQVHTVFKTLLFTINSLLLDMSFEIDLDIDWIVSWAFLIYSTHMYSILLVGCKSVWLASFAVHINWFFNYLFYFVQMILGTIL